MLRKFYSNEPKRTLSFLHDDDEDDGLSAEVTTRFDRQKSKTEKSVHFADEESIVGEVTNNSASSSSQGSHGIVSWLPSEHLYSEDTFIHDTESTVYKVSHDENTSNPTRYSYGTSSFIQPDSDEDKTDNTDTEQMYSYTDSFVSSDVFSNQSDASGTYKEWKDVTEIVKDIEELEEIEFVTRVDSLQREKDEDDTEVSDSLDEEIAEAARYKYISNAIHHLQQRQHGTLHDLSIGSIDFNRNIHNFPSTEPRSVEEKKFCRKMLQRLKKNSDKHLKTDKDVKVPIHSLYAEVKKMEEDSRRQPLEFYGLNSALVESLKLDNLQCSLKKKSQNLGKQTKESENFINNTVNDEVLARDKFVSQVCAQVRRENIDDAIQAHLIKMNPVTKFAEFVKDLPKCDEDVREILYKYRRQLESRMDTDIILHS